MVVKKSVHPAREEGNLLSHVDLVQMLDIVDLEQGTTVAGKCCCIESVSDCDIFLVCMAWLWLLIFLPLNNLKDRRRLTLSPISCAKKFFLKKPRCI